MILIESLLIPHWFWFCQCGFYLPELPVPLLFVSPLGARSVNAGSLCVRLCCCQFCLCCIDSAQTGSLWVRCGFESGWSVTDREVERALRCFCSWCLVEQIVGCCVCPLPFSETLCTVTKELYMFGCVLCVHRRKRGECHNHCCW